MIYRELLEKYGSLEAVERLFFYEVVYLTKGMKASAVYAFSEDDIYSTMKRRSEFIKELKECGVLPNQELFAVDINACGIEKYFEGDRDYQAETTGKRG